MVTANIPIPRHFWNPLSFQDLEHDRRSIQECSDYSDYYRDRKQTKYAKKRAHSGETWDYPRGGGTSEGEGQKRGRQQH